MVKRRLRLRKRVWVFLIILIFLSIGIYSGIKIHQDLEYKKTLEYKFTSIGYTLDDLKLLQEKTDEKTINDILVKKVKDDFLLSLVNEKFYIKDYLDRYRTYKNEHTEVDSKTLVATINTNRDYSYYDHDIESDTEKDYLLITNKYYKLNSDYTPSDLVSVSNKYYYGSNHKIRKVCYDAFIDMWNDAYKEGIYLIINSSFRDYESQVKVYDDYKNSQGTSYADSIAARPGYSEHQTGLSLDIFSKKNLTIGNFKDSEAHIWLQNNAYKYGFIERYKEEFENITGFSAEAWHWRYVGVEAATYIYENNITFDEYYAYFIENGIN